MKTILHADLNSFYASVEIMQHPELKHKPVAVCGATETRHGIILAKSQLAKEAGVKTAMTNVEAKRLCPNLIMLPPHYDEYLKYSQLTRQIYERYTDFVEPFGMDECWLDVTHSRIYGSGREIAEEIRKTIKSELGLTVSIGVSFTKIFAKLGSDMKKPDAITELPPDAIPKIVYPLPVSDLLYVGPATANKLRNYAGISTIGQLAHARPDMLKDLLGINGIKLWEFANGIDNARVKHKHYIAPIKSIGRGITCTEDLHTDEAVWKVMLALAQDVGHKLRLQHVMATGVQISLREKSLLTRQYQEHLPFPTQSPKYLAQEGKKLLVEKYPWAAPIRAVTIRAINLIPDTTPQQLDLFTDFENVDKQEKAEAAIETIRRRFGKRAIVPACLMGDLKMPDDGRDEVILPGMLYI